jgi:hypothetical protein
MLLEVTVDHLEDATLPVGQVNTGRDHRRSSLVVGQSTSTCDPWCAVFDGAYGRSPRRPCKETELETELAFELAGYSLPFQWGKHLFGAVDREARFCEPSRTPVPNIRTACHTLAVP